MRLQGAHGPATAPQVQSCFATKIFRHRIGIPEIKIQKPGKEAVSGATTRFHLARVPIRKYDIYNSRCLHGWARFQHWRLFKRLALEDPSHSATIWIYSWMENIYYAMVQPLWPLLPPCGIIQLFDSSPVNQSASPLGNRLAPVAVLADSRPTPKTRIMSSSVP